MASEKANYPVKMMARTLDVSRSGFYSWLKRGDAPDDFSSLKVAIKAVWERSKRRLGARGIHAKITSDPDFQNATLYRVRACMRELGICGVCPRPKKKTTVPDKDAPARPDLIGRDFTSPVPTYKLVSDITYLRTDEGWLYLDVILDLATRMVVGWAFSDSLATPLIIEAANRAYSRGYIAHGAIYHSDYTAKITKPQNGQHTWSSKEFAA